MKAIVCGNELVTDEADVFAALDQARRGYKFLTLVTTGKPGVERMARNYAAKHGLGHEVYVPPGRNVPNPDPFGEFVQKVNPEIVIVVGHDKRALRIADVALERQAIVAYTSLTHDPKPEVKSDAPRPR